MIRKDTLMPISGFFTALGRKSKKISINYSILIHEFFSIIACFLIGRAVILEELAPFGIALFTIVLVQGKGGFSAFLAISAGLLSYRFGEFSFRYISVMVVIFLLWTVLKKRIKASKFRASLLVPLGLFIVNMIFLSIYGFTMYDFLLGVIDATIGFTMFYILHQISELTNGSKRRSILSGEEIICLSILLALLVIGVWDTKLLGCSIKNILSIFIIILFAFLGGAGVGAIIGVSVGFMLSLSSAPDPLIISNLAVCGLMAGVFRELGKVGSSSAFLLSNIIMTFYINESTFIILPFQEIIGGVLILLIFPQKGLEFLKGYIDYIYLQPGDGHFHGKRLQEITVGRLNEFSRVFKHLANVLGRTSEDSQAITTDEISELFDYIVSQVCYDCALYRSCWERDYSKTYSNMFGLLARCEEKGTLEKEDMPKSLYRRCLNSDRLIEVMNNVYALYLSEFGWYQRMLDCKQLVAEQLDGVSNAVTQLASELDMEINFKNDIENQIRIALDKGNIEVNEVLVLEKAGGRLEVCISKRSCNHKYGCIKEIEDVISNSLGRLMSSESRECAFSNENGCRLRLVESRKFEVVTGVARKPMKGNVTSGDSYSFLSIKDGRYLLALSDGMGAGQRAAEESSAVVTLLENFMEAGFDQDITIKTINSVLMLRSREDMFATADLCILDLVGATADFIKIGGVSSFIIRENKVEIIKQAALPIGILSEVQSESITIDILEEDIIIMVTDGILDAFAIFEDRERALANYIATLNTENTQEISDLIMEEALLHSGEAKDDMTVMTSRIWRPY